MVSVYSHCFSQAPEHRIQTSVFRTAAGTSWLPGKWATPPLLEPLQQQCCEVCRRQDIGQATLLVSKPTNPAYRAPLSRPLRVFSSDGHWCSGAFREVDMHLESGETALSSLVYAPLN